jgi:hypothetical protein
MKMREWLAKKFLIWAVRLDCDVVVQASRLIVVLEDARLAAAAPKKKRGRPAGRKDSVGGVPVKRKLGRPLGSKNRPKIVVKPEAEA